MHRIGRAANPAERGLQHVLEHEEILDHVAMNRLGYERAMFGIPLQEYWLQLTDAERERWKSRAVHLLREHVAAYQPATPPDDPEPGGRRPVVRVA